jgi:hypothetical protein
MAGIREVEYGDLEAVGRLVSAEGWRAPTACDWRWLWEENPAAQRSGISRGWVLVEGSAVVGFLANIAQQYQLGDRHLTAAVASGLVVAPAFRGSSLQLLLAHARQRNVDLLLNTTAAPHVSKISQFLKFQRIPQPAYDRSLYWVLRARPFAGAALRKKGYRDAVDRWGGALLAPLIRLEGALRRRGPRRVRSRAEFRTIGAGSIGSEFDGLWRRRLAERPRLLAVRDAQTLRWHFADRGRPHSPFLVCASIGSQLLGYMAVVRQDARHLGLARARVADIFVERDDPEIIRQLLHQSAEHARRTGAAMLEVIGLPQPLRRIFEALRPFELVDDSWPFLYKAVDPALQETLADESVWYAGLFDGDGSV